MMPCLPLCLTDPFLDRCACLCRSYNHTGTVLYDQFQLATNGIAP
jgi:hypothetical protein